MNRESDRQVRWVAPRALVAHLLVLCFVPGCLIAGWWQATVAMSGNGLSYLYAFEWPVFAIFSVVLWWNFLHDDPDEVGGRRLRELRRDESISGERAELRSPDFRTEDEDDELRAYNDYLAQLAQRDRAKGWRSR